ARFFFFLRILPPPTSPLFPYTTLFRSLALVLPAYRDAAQRAQIEISTTPFYHPILPLICDSDIARVANPATPLPRRAYRRPEDRSEEHTSELQSRGHLVCRLLLEKKKN